MARRSRQRRRHAPAESSVLRSGRSFSDATDDYLPSSGLVNAPDALPVFRRPSAISDPRIDRYGRYRASDVWRVGDAFAFRSRKNQWGPAGVGRGLVAYGLAQRSLQGHLVSPRRAPRVPNEIPAGVHLEVCVKRYVRRQVLHAFGLTRRAGAGGPRKRSVDSSIRC